MKIRGSNIIEALYAKYMPVPFLSILTNDCIASGKDYNAGGARYNTSVIQGVAFAENPFVRQVPDAACLDIPARPPASSAGGRAGCPPKMRRIFGEGL